MFYTSSASTASAAATWSLRSAAAWWATSRALPRRRISAAWLCPDPDEAAGPRSIRPVGGKTAVDLPTGKNQAGSFYQPCIVICDPNTLETLHEEQYRCGCAEIIKYSMLGNAAFFEELYKTPVREQYEHVIEVCVQMKRDIVGADEYDLGRRRTLNLGHTFGHAVEQCSDFSLLHGEAVAIGMATVTRAAVKRGICGEETLARLLDILHRYGLPTETGYELDKLYEAELVDKKISGGKMHLIVPEKIGQVRMETIPVEALRDWMQDGGIR